MCCTTLFADEATMTTTQLTRTVSCAVSWPQQGERTVNQKRLHMSWVVVTDEKGRNQLRACWNADRED